MAKWYDFAFVFLVLGIGTFFFIFYTFLWTFIIPAIIGALIFYWVIDKMRFPNKCIIFEPREYGKKFMSADRWGRRKDRRNNLDYISLKHANAPANKASPIPYENIIQKGKSEFVFLMHPHETTYIPMKIKDIEFTSAEAESRNIHIQTVDIIYRTFQAPDRWTKWMPVLILLIVCAFVVGMTFAWGFVIDTIYQKLVPEIARFTEQVTRFTGVASQYAAATSGGQIAIPPQ